jgi:hypothetical protein
MHDLIHNFVMLIKHVVMQQSSYLLAISKLFYKDVECCLFRCDLLYIYAPPYFL